MKHERPGKNLRVSDKAHEYLRKRAFREKKKMNQLVEEFCFPKGIPVKTLKGV
jgi:predicted HicB family RNase H-like nuclease